jgi:hypothetical protein
VKADPLLVQIKIANTCDVPPEHPTTTNIADDAINVLKVTPRDAEAPKWT